VICGQGDFWRETVQRAVTIAPFACRDQQVLFERTVSWVRHCARSTAECATPRCMQAIDLERVVAAIDDLFPSGKPSPVARCAESPVT
jgi:hypothetical protein